MANSVRLLSPWLLITATTFHRKPTYHAVLTRCSDPDAATRKDFPAPNQRIPLLSTCWKPRHVLGLLLYALTLTQGVLR